MKLTDISYARSVMERHGIAPQKRFGQNFLINENVVCRIADTAGFGDSELGILEIGPGIGTLTQKLAERYKKVIAIEIDTSLLPVLEDTLSEYDNVKVIHGDAMKVDLEALVREEFAGMRVAVCANLPYYITSPVIMRLLETDGLFESVTVMIQKEVAKRICAKPGNADYGAFSLFVQWYMETELLFDVPASCFVPQPKVTSSVIRLKKRTVPQGVVKDEELMFKIIRAAFNQRRKTLVNAISAGVNGITKEAAERAIADSGLDVRVRGEALGIAEFIQIADRLTSD